MPNPPSLGFRHGVGADLISVERCRALLQRQGELVWQRLGCPPPEEKDPAEFLAKRWACFEAVWKATMACGLHLSLTQIHILHDETGRPGWVLRTPDHEPPYLETPTHQIPVRLSFQSGPLGGCLFRLFPVTEISPSGWLLSSLSVSDDANFATAFCSCVLQMDS